MKHPLRVLLFADRSVLSSVWCDVMVLLCVPDVLTLYYCGSLFILSS